MAASGSQQTNRTLNLSMARLLKRPEAEKDLDDIWWQIAQDKPLDADRFLDRIQETLLTLTEFPRMGVNQDKLMLGLRSFTVGNYLIFYFPLEEGVDVIRVLHGARELNAIFHPDE